MNTVNVEGRRVKETDSAVLWETPEGVEVWLPLSQVEAFTVNPKGEGTMKCSTWIAKMKGLA
jgi:hypothetical protein